MESLTSISLLNDDQPHSLGDLVREFVEFCEKREVNCIGIGERMHGDGSFQDILVPHLLPAFAKVGYKTLLCEYIIRDTDTELEAIYKILDGWMQYSFEERVHRLAKLIIGNPAFEILEYNYTGILEGAYKINILPLIVMAHALGVKIEGMVYSNQVVDDDYVMSAIIADGGREQAFKLKKQGKLLIYSGDMHAIAKQLQIVSSNPHYKTPYRLSFGVDLYNDPDTRYINLTLLCGTADSLKRENSDPKNLVFAQSGLKFYLERFAGVKPGMARYNYIEQEGERRAVIVYNNSSNINKP